MATSFVKKVNLKFVKKGRKYWSCIQHWQGHGTQRDYPVKTLIDDSNKDIEEGTELTDYLVEVQKEESRYGTKRLLVPIGNKQYEEDRSENIYKAIKNKWTDENFIPSAGDVRYVEDQREELKKLNVTKYDDEISKLVQLAVARRNIKFIREQFADDMYINEKRIANLHNLNCFDYDDEIAEMRRKKKEAEQAEREAKKAKRKQWLENHFTRQIPADSGSEPKIGSMTVVAKNGEDGETTYRAGKCISCRFVSDEDNVSGYGDIYYAEYEDISETEAGKELIDKYKAQKKADKQKKEWKKSLRKLASWVEKNNQLKEKRINLKLTDLTILFDDQNIFGGGETIALDVDKKQVWYIVHHHMDGDNWAANNVYFNKESADGFGDAIGYMASSEECQSLIDKVVELSKNMN